MIEIAICIAVIGFALVAIIGVLPIGMNVQRENREETVINFDANYLMDAVRSGARGLDNLTNYVNNITIISTLCDSNALPLGASYTNVYTLANGLTNGFNVVSLLSTPKYFFYNNPAGSYFSNSVTADFRAINGVPTDQAVDQTSKDFAFTYRVAIELVPSAGYPFAASDASVATDNAANDPNGENFSAPGLAITNATPTPWTGTVPKNLQASMTEIRMRFYWPVLPGNRLGNGRATYRSAMGGQLAQAQGMTLPPPAPFPYFFIMQPQAYSATQ